MTESGRDFLGAGPLKIGFHSRSSNFDCSAKGAANRHTQWRQCATSRKLQQPCRFPKQLWQWTGSRNGKETTCRGWIGTGISCSWSWFWAMMGVEKASYYFEGSATLIPKEWVQSYKRLTIHTFTKPDLWYLLVRNKIEIRYIYYILWFASAAMLKLHVCAGQERPDATLAGKDSSNTSTW